MFVRGARRTRGAASLGVRGRRLLLRLLRHVPGSEQMLELELDEGLHVSRMFMSAITTQQNTQRNTSPAITAVTAAAFPRALALALAAS